MTNKRNIPDFFGIEKDALSLGEWKKTREEIKKIFLDTEYGNLPKKISPKTKIVPNYIDFSGKAVWEDIFFEFENEGKTHEVKTELILPRGQKNVPVFVYISFAKETPNKYLPVEEIIDNGFGIFSFCYENVTSDNGDFSNGLCGLFEGDFGKISIWSYMAIACMDYLQTRDEVDKKNIAICGHSRLGKTALLTSALDDRFALTCSNDSGCCGASVSRGKVEGNETLVEITKVFPFWFTKEFLKYRENPDALPFDQHLLLSLIAPRYLVIGTANEDFWADNDGQFLACQLSSFAWKLYGKDGLIENSKYDTVCEMLDGELCFYQRKGTHFLSRSDWHMYIKKFKEIINVQK